eukprot:gnl/Spiro4/16107_TR8663_c0_g1_i1.p3 gnl/Spiro4/16107_TR8663_c0_g1~~gnl/Spiro4/16107_TR8663_c0_g1_i1.p3  ORF type:complete len:216 (+),score=46.10 gnl/Spiro4/16107_TR8663_c0_g1_i1:60-650(+)
MLSAPLWCLRSGARAQHVQCAAAGALRLLCSSTTTTPAIVTDYKHDIYGSPSEPVRIPGPNDELEMSYLPFPSNRADSSPHPLPYTEPPRVFTKEDEKSPLATDRLIPGVYRPTIPPKVLTLLSATHLKITLQRNANKRPEYAKTLRCMGFGTKLKPQTSVLLPNTRSVRGWCLKVKHLIKIEKAEVDTTEKTWYC